MSGISATSYAAVGETTSQFDPAVYGHSANTTAVAGETPSDDAAVFGNSGGGPGVRGKSFSAEGLRANRRTAAGSSRRPRAPRPVSTRPRPAARRRRQGWSRAAAAVPTTKAGAPTTGAHAMGEFSVDKAGALFLCTVAGNPGSWKKVTVS